MFCFFKSAVCFSLIFISKMDTNASLMFCDQNHQSQKCKRKNKQKKYLEEVNL